MNQDARTSRRQWAALTLIVQAALLLLGCSETEESPSRQAASQSAASQAALDRFVAAEQPGCSAAVGRRGKVMWRGAQGVADLNTGAPITPETIFDIGSTSKQFTATAVLLLADSRRLELDDPLARYVDGLPQWSRHTSLDHLVHHTSGIPDYLLLLTARGHAETDRTTQRQALQTLTAIERLEFDPGSSWRYSNSNYVLLAEVVQAVTGQMLPDYLRQEVFDPLGLEMEMDPVGRIPGKAVSYQGAPSFTVADSKWEQIGDGAIQTTPSQLVLWADNYRTGKLGGASVLKARLADAVLTPDDSRYGAGIFELTDGSLSHGGQWGGFQTEFWISEDRSTAISITCNMGGIDIDGIRRSLADIWATS